MTTFAEATELWLQREADRGERKPERIEEYRLRFERQINPYIGELPVNEIDDAAVVAMKKARKADAKHAHKKPSEESHYKDVQAIRTVLTFVRDKTKCPMSVRLPDMPKRPKTRHATVPPEQFPILLDHIDRGGDKWLLAYVRLQRLTGMRPCEVDEIQLRDFGAINPSSERDENYIHVPGAKTRGGKNTPRPFYVHGDAEERELRDVLDLIRSIHPTPDDRNALVFGKAGWTKPKTAWNRRFKAALRELDKLQPGQGWLVDEAGDRLVFYSLRHFFITDRLLEHGDTMEWVADMCGTSVKEIKEHYDHVSTLQHRKKYLDGKKAAKKAA